MKKNFILHYKTVAALFIFCSLTFSTKAQVTYLYEGFDAVTPAGWTNVNNSDPKSTQKWQQGDAEGYFPSFSGDSSSYAEADFLNIKAGLSGTISTWLITPQLSLANGAVITFYTRTDDFAGTEYPDRLQVRLSTNGNSSNAGSLPTDVGDFTTTLLEINPQQQPAVYPQVWTKYTVVLGNIPAGATGRIAFRYYVENGGAGGTASTYIGLDDVTYNMDVLPVTLTSFTGLLQSGKAMLSWSTASEVNNAGFEVEKSTDGRDYYKIGFVANHGSATASTPYKYTDATLNEGISYYRLKQIDKNGGYKYSAVISISYHSFNWSITGYPGNRSLQLQLDRNANVKIDVIAVNGIVLETINKETLNAGSYSIPLSNQATKGVYIINLSVNNKTYSKKVLL